MTTHIIIRSTTTDPNPVVADLEFTNRGVALDLVCSALRSQRGGSLGSTRSWKMSSTITTILHLFRPNQVWTILTKHPRTPKDAHPTSSQ